jgi:hypothetical protein
MSYTIGADNTARTVQVPVAGVMLTLQQTASMEVGTSLWDSAVLLVSHLEREVAGRGPLSSSRLRGSRVVELGSGCGVAGLAFAAHGSAHVMMTDKEEVIGHLEANIQANSGASVCGSCELRCAPYLWGTEPLGAGLEPPYDFVIGTDCIYLQEQIAPFLASLIALSDSRTCVVVAMERRDETVWAEFERELKQAFRVRRINLKKSRNGEPSTSHLGIFIARRAARRSCGDADGDGGGDADLLDAEPDLPQDHGACVMNRVGDPPLRGGM